MNELGRIVATFRDRFHLSKAKASQILGVSVPYIRSLEEGRDVHTGLAFKPRESTLRQLAVRMSEFGYPVAYEDLMVAAGHLTRGELEFYAGSTPSPTDDEIAQGNHGVPGVTDIAAHSDARWDELSPTEQREVVEAIGALRKLMIEQKLQGRRPRKLK